MPTFRNWLQPGSIPRGVPIPGGSEQAFLAVLEEIGTPVIWLGWSGGGSLGLSLVTQRPDLFRAFIGIESVGGGCLTGGSPDPAVVDAFADNDIPFFKR